MRMQATRRAWSGVAAYLYVLELDAGGLAWEYVRRSPAYQLVWRHRHQLPADAAAPWLLAHAEDPSLDARQAHPVWQYPCADQIGLQSARRVQNECMPVFNLWSLPGRKQVRALPGGYALQVRQVLHTLRAVCDVGVMEGAAAMLVLPLNRRPTRQLRALQTQLSQASSEPLFRGASLNPLGQTYRESRDGRLHLRALMALDAFEANASHRDIAVALVGETDTRSQWHADSSLRGQIRYYLRRGRYFRDGGYQRLLA